MASSHPPYLAVGHVNKAHGTRGEVFVWSLTSHPESSFAPGVILHVGTEGEGGPDSTEPSLEVEGVRPFRRGYLVKIRGVEDRDRAGELVGRYLLRPVEELEALEEGELFYHQLLGMEVRTAEGLEVGEITEVYELRPAHLLEVRGGGSTRLIPFRREFVREVDLEEGRIMVDLPEGFLDL